ncbi:MAG: ABC transporter ATP-binding protein [Burkholderiales bacterium]
MLSVRRLCKSYGSETGRTVFRNVDLDVAPGEFVAVMGESGVGKSTLLNLIAGLDKPDAGYIWLDGVEVSELDDNACARLRARRMGFVFQAFYLLPYLTVAQNVVLPLIMAGFPESGRNPRVRTLLESVGLAGHEHRYPRELSGGEMQRVAIVRALVHEPQLVLADEPTGNLDSDNARQVLALLQREVRRVNAGAILVTHSSIAAASADRVYHLDGGGLHPQNASRL